MNTVFSPIEPPVALFFNPKILKIFTLLPPDARQEKGGGSIGENTVG
jgi:hypothetical protein